MIWMIGLCRLTIVVGALLCLRQLHTPEMAALAGFVFCLFMIKELEPK